LTLALAYHNVKAMKIFGHLAGLWFVLLAILPEAVSAMPRYVKVSLDGVDVSFPDDSAKATVLIFLSAKCPCSASHESDLAKLVQQYHPLGFQFIGIHSNQDENSVLTKAHFQSAKLPFPVIEDPGARLADDFKALKTPHVFIVKSGEILFQGGVDDSAEASNAKKHYLSDALKQLSEGRAIETSRARALGCAIKR
jgi:hypothetical protein